MDVGFFSGLLGGCGQRKGCRGGRKGEGVVVSVVGVVVV